MENNQKMKWYEKVGKWIKGHKNQVVFGVGIACGVGLTVGVFKKIEEIQENNILGSRIRCRNIDGENRIGIMLQVVQKNGKVLRGDGIGLTYPIAKEFAEEILESIPKEV